MAGVSGGELAFGHFLVQRVAPVSFVDDDAIKRFKRKWHETFFVDARSCPIYLDVQSYISPSGIEYFAPLFFDRMADFFDYVPKSTLFVLEPGLEERLSEFQLKLTQRYNEMSHDLERPILDPSELFLNPEELHESIKTIQNHPY